LASWAGARLPIFQFAKYHIFFLAKVTQNIFKIYEEWDIYVPFYGHNRQRRKKCMHIAQTWTMMQMARQTPFSPHITRTEYKIIHTLKLCSKVFRNVFVCERSNKNTCISN
jgi:hypothetical protein